MSDRICITMPKDLYEFLLSIPVAQDYSLQVGVGAQKGQRDAEYQITFRMSEKFKCFEPVLRVLQDNVPIFDYSGWPEKCRLDFDCFIDMDFERALRVATKANFHITMGLNVLIGSGAGMLPILKALQLPEKSDLDILLLPWDKTETEKFYEYMLNNHPELNVILDDRDISQFTIEDILQYANSFGFVIGPNSPVTYLATALKKGVIEVFKTAEEGTLYGSNGISGYQGIAGNNSLTASYMWLVWRRQWQVIEHIRALRSQGVPILKEEHLSTAAPVEEKSS